MTESLPGVDSLLTYQFRHGGAPLMDLPLAVNPSGCARCEPRFRTLIKHQQRPLTTGTSRSSNTEVPLPTSNNQKQGRTRGAQNSNRQDDIRALLVNSGLDPAMAMYAQGISLNTLTGNRVSTVNAPCSLLVIEVTMLGVN